MLQITVPATEFYDEVNNEFIETKECKLSLEHSLVSLSKWESKWCKSFLSSENNLGTEEVRDYARCMTINQNVDPNVYLCLTKQNLEEISEYIKAPMTATWFRQEQSKGTNKDIITSELIYYWMIALNIPFECQKWHLNRLMTLIQVCNIKNSPSKKMSKRDILAQNKALNDARRAKMHSKG